MKKHGKESKLFQLIDRKFFDQLVEKWEMDKWVREFGTWEMTCTLVTAMAMRLGSYREIEQALGVPHATLGDAMMKRFSGFFSELCDQTLLNIRHHTQSRKMRKAICQILALDSSEIKVHGSLFSSPGWRQQGHCERTAAAKLHVMWDVEGQWIDECIVTGVRRGDSPVGQLFKIKRGNIYVFDRAYCDVKFWLNIRVTGADFVTRLRSLSIKKIEKERTEDLKAHDGVLYDGIYTIPKDTLYGRSTKAERHDLNFRYVVYRDPATKKVFYFVTSNWSLPAQTIADIYKKRWAVELLFRWLKGHLDIRYLAAKNKNAIQIQLAIAVLIQLLLQLSKIKNQYQGSLWELLRSIRMNLMRQALALSEPPEGCRWKTPLREGIPIVYL